MSWQEVFTINLLSFIGHLFFSLGLAYMFVKYVCERSKISGSSMNPHFKHHDVIIIEKLSYRFRKPKRFEVIAIPMNKQIKRAYYVKRIIGMPGESIQIKKGYVYINDHKLDEYEGVARIKRPGLAQKKIRLNADEYFVLGDNRNASLDSRDVQVGLVARGDIVGRAWIKMK